MRTECRFCRIADRQDEAEVLYEDADVLGFEDSDSGAPVHVVLIPKRHVESANALREGDAKEIAALVLAATKVARDRDVAGSGYRLVLNMGQDAGEDAVPHLRLHLLGGRRLRWPPS